MYKLLIASNIEYIKTEIVILLKSIDLSRLNVTALDNNINKIEYINIVLLGLEPNIYINYEHIYIYVYIHSLKKLKLCLQKFIHFIVNILNILKKTVLRIARGEIRILILNS